MKHAKFSTLLLTVVIALIFQLYPWSSDGLILRPDFLLVVSIYWLLSNPQQCNIGLVWFAGILVDMSTGSLLGQHAMSFAITAFLGLSYQRRIVLFSRWQMIGYVLILFSVQRLLILMLKLFADNESPGWSYMLPVVSDLMLWQLMTIVFGELTRPKQR